MMDRFIAVENAKYVMNTMGSFADEVEFRSDGLIVKRAKDVLAQTLDFLRVIESKGLLDAIGEGLFAEVKRPKDGGKGLEGLVKKGEEYWNPVEDGLKAGLGLPERGRDYAKAAGAAACGAAAGARKGE
jgi:beta-lysine 5,6-aminomutase alpha subunit